MKQKKFIIVLPTWPVNQERQEHALKSFISLVRTRPLTEEKIPLWIIEKSFGISEAARIVEFNSSPFELRILIQPPGVDNTDPVWSWGATEMFKHYADAEYLIYLTDDLLYSPDWLSVLDQLIDRHPEAKAWSVYRSAHEYHHKTLEVRGDDVLVRSISGNGTCITRQEWIAWDVDYRAGSWPVATPEGGNTLDLHHAWARSGERWVTRRSWIEHIGIRGRLCSPGVPEHAIDFVGVG